ncbi:DUF3810 domain-containing protein [Cellulophaga sp. F20128]|uniref:DUF3810 domain-containing protein n=1 Tax=Cellulophaga sp. F20128 TaxID=2926413 RepID=UPI001FF5D737|nr:DUF3810 domain-containing protein [Cellulophaga sp. F20128]MCK0157630.1 DUF3810 domain-containing protein [Cellulophaga sp. F20128]
MNNKLKNGIALLLPIQIVMVKWLANYPDFIEQYYSNGIYQYTATFFRFVLGWIPFSVGDILYALLVLIAVRYIIVKRNYIKHKPLSFLRNITVVLSIAYFTFHITWGFNYYREPLYKTLQIKNSHTLVELEDFVNLLVQKTNTIHYTITQDTTKRVVIPYTKAEIFKHTMDGYTQLEQKYPFLSYTPSSLKTSLFSTGLSYSGYGGYLNPFTNEAQVNGKIPLYRFPVIAGHEAGHQIGYSAENETNFIGYLVTANNTDIYFKYAAYSYALSYCLSDIRYNDEALFNTLYAKLNVGVKKNYQELSDFWMTYNNPLEPTMKTIYSTFLKANNQADGIKSYSRIVSLLVSYHMKNPL